MRKLNIPLFESDQESIGQHITKLMDRLKKSLTSLASKRSRVDNLGEIIRLDKQAPTRPEEVKIVEIAKEINENIRGDYDSIIDDAYDEFNKVMFPYLDSIIRDINTSLESSGLRKLEMRPVRGFHKSIDEKMDIDGNRTSNEPMIGELELRLRLYGITIDFGESHKGVIFFGTKEDDRGMDLKKSSWYGENEKKISREFEDRSFIHNWRRFKEHPSNISWLDLFYNLIERMANDEVLINGSTNIMQWLEMSDEDRSAADVTAIF